MPRSQSELEPFQKLLKIEGFVGSFRSLVYALGDAGLAFDRCHKISPLAQILPTGPICVVAN
jgi:hypothetical protein